MSTVLAVDVGTTAVKAALVADGGVVRVVERSLQLQSPQPGWAEQLPGDWWTATVAAVTALDVGDATVDAIAVTGQMQDLIPLDRDGAAVGPALLYADARAGDEHAELQRQLGDAWAAAVGFPPDATNVAAKWLWLTRHRPDVANATAVVAVGAHSYVVGRLTGTVVADPTSAATTGLFDVAAGQWWAAVVDAVGISLPPISEPTSITGRLIATAAGELGLPAGIPVVHANGDAAATTIGLLGREVGRSYVSVGTSAWAATAVAERPTCGDAIVLPGLDADHWIVAAQMPVAGAAIDWARAALLGGVDHASFDELAASACAAAAGVLFVPHLDGARFPQPLADATGVLVGVRRSTDRATIAAAVAEGVAHAVRQLLAAIDPGDTTEHVGPPAVGQRGVGRTATGRGGEIGVTLPVDESEATIELSTGGLLLCGGATRMAAFTGAVADVIGADVTVVAAEHASVCGAAVAAELALGATPRVDAGAATIVRHDPARHAAHRRLASTFDALLPTIAPALTELAVVGPSAAERPTAASTQTSTTHESLS